MSLVVEDGTGLANAESYSSVAEADAYHTAHDTGATWLNVSTTTSDKEAALRRATQYIEARWRRLWSGRRANQSQALAWPRLEVYDADEYAVESATVPQQVKDACSILAAAALDDGDLLATLDAGSGNKSESTIKVGPIQITDTFAGSSSQQKTYSLAEQLIEEFLGVAGEFERA